MALGPILVFNLAALTCSCLIVWTVSLARRDASIVDIFWGIGFVFVAWMTYANTEYGGGARSMATVLLVSIWGLRLAGYLAWRNLGKGEDYRYASEVECRCATKTASENCSCNLLNLQPAIF